MNDSYSKDELLGEAGAVLDENRGWWDSDDPDDQERINDINRTQELLNEGKLEDPYGVIQDAYGDYHEFIANSEDSDFDNGAAGKQAALDELDALLDAID